MTDRSSPLARLHLTVRAAATGRSRAIGLLAVLVSLIGPAALAPAAVASRLVGGRQEGAIRHAFTSSRAGHGQTIASIRVSSVSPAWSLVRSVDTPAAGRTTSRTVPLTLHSTFLHRTGGGERLGSPPRAVRADLSRPLRVAIVYSGSGGDTVGYTQNYSSVCQGAGGFVDTQSVSVAPMAWTVRWIVDLDSLRGAEAGAVAPAVAFSAAGSQVRASEQIERQIVDNGCNARPATFRCHETFRAGGPDAAGQLSLLASGGLQLGVPMAVTRTGSCDASDYTLGASLWDGGGATATVSRLDLTGGPLPSNPYAPIEVAWPGNSAGAAGGFATSPCAGDQAVCADSFHWRGTVRLQPVG